MIHHGCGRSKKHDAASVGSSWCGPRLNLDSPPSSLPRHHSLAPCLSRMMQAHVERVIHLSDAAKNRELRYVALARGALSRWRFEPTVEMARTRLRFFAGLVLPAPALPAMIRYPLNEIKTYKYSTFTFLPKCLFEQFRRVANVYFLAISVLQVRARVSRLVLDAGRGVPSSARLSP